MKIKMIPTLLVGIASLCAITNLTAKPEDFGNAAYTASEVEFYLEYDQIQYIRPGLEIEILEAVIPADKQLLVTYSLKDPGGLPLDIDGIYTPGPVDMRYMLTYIPQFEEQKVKLTEGSRDADGTLESLGDGVYTYKFGTVISDVYDPDATHVLALVGRRDLRDYDLDRYVDNEVLNFVPSGLFDPVPRDVVTTETCNGRCHDPLAMHGGRYVEIDVCSQCHNPGLFARNGSGDSKSLDVIIHQVHKELEEGYTAQINDCEVCHTGGIPTENFPMVASPTAALVCDSSGLGATTLSWQHTGNVEVQVRTADDQEGKLFATGGGTGSSQTGKWVRDGVEFDLYDSATMELLVTVPVNATVLGCVSNPPGAMVGEPGLQHTNWMDHPSRVVCGSCHDHVNFETGEGHSEFEIIQPDDNSCGNCHVPEAGEFDRSVRGAHLELFKSAQLPGVLVDFIEVTNTNPGNTPSVTFSLGSKKGRLNPADLDRLRLTIVGPNDDFSFYTQETVGSAAVPAGDNWVYTFDTPLPMDAVGSYTVTLEGRNEVPVDFGDEISDERDVAEPPSLAFAVTDATATPRRIVVDDAKCEGCHVNLALHGGGRRDIQYCNTCHAPDVVDIATPAESVHMKWMIHKIHRGEDLEFGYVVTRSRGVFDFSDKVFPGDLRNCDTCHVNDSQQLPLPQGLLPTSTPTVFWDPTMPAAAACLSCHDGEAAAAHAYTNTTFFGESCATCHGEGKFVSVDKVHAR